MSINQLTNYLCENPQEIIKILELTDFYNISFFESKNEIRCAYYEGGNPTSVCINCNTLQAYVFSKDVGGSLYHIICLHNNWTLSKTIRFIQNSLNLSDDFKTESFYIFNGVYKQVSRQKEKEINILPKSLLDDYKPYCNMRFYNDNISFNTQRKFGIRYDMITNRIIVPWYNQNGDLVGLTGRYNFDDLNGHPKWKTMKNFQKGNFLYGLYENYQDIKKSGYVIVGESEKFTMQLDSFGYHNGLSLGSCNITEKQAILLKALPVSKIILGLDEGVSVEHILYQCEKLQGGIFNSSKEIWCIFDREHRIMKKDTKVSPTDLGKENFEYLLKNCCFRKEKKNE